MMKKILIIHNPYSGNQKDFKDTKKELINVANDNDCLLDFVQTKKRDDAVDIICGADYYDLVVSMGGDGTFNEVVRGNIKRKDRLLLSHLPVGTTNDLKDSFGFSGNTVEIFNSILKGKNVTYDVLEINKIPFTYAAGVGLFLDIPYSTTKQDKIKCGYFAYINNAIFDIITKGIKLYHIKYKVDNVEKEVNAPFILVSNSNHMGGLKLYNDSKLNDGKFEVLIPKSNSAIKLICGLFRVKNGKKSKYFKLIKTDNIQIIINENTKNWCIDGEELKENNKVYDIKILKKIKCRVSNEAKNYI